MTTRNPFHNHDDLLSALRKGQEDAYEYLFREYYKPLCLYACAFLKDMDKGEELVQECFFNIWEIRKRLNISTSVKFYLFRAVKNRCLNFLKQEQNRRGILYSLDEEFVNREEFFIESVSDTESHTKMENRISEAMNLLPAGCREIFEMGKMSGMTYRQIADELNISVKTVENQMSKALRILRKELSSEMFLLLCFFRKE